MSSEYMPNTDAAILAWMSAFMTCARENLAVLGLSPAAMDAMVEQASAFDAACTQAVNTHHQARAATQTRIAARRSAEGLFRSIVRQVQANPSLTDAQRQALGITLRNGSAGLPSAPTLAAALPRPMCLVDSGSQLMHVVRYAQDREVVRRARPEGIRAVEICMAVLPRGAAGPEDPATMRTLAMPTRAPYRVHFAAADAGQIAWYRIRWVDRSNTPVGEWSRPVGVMIVG